MNKIDRFVYEKICRYCAYQERAPFEIRQKLKSLNIKDEYLQEFYIQELEKDNFLSEKRFAELYTQSKFHQLKWGKEKIEYELLLKKVPREIIRYALNTIDNEEYNETLQKIIHKRNHLPKSKIIHYCLLKGYDYEEIRCAMEAYNSNPTFY